MRGMLPRMLTAIFFALALAREKGVVEEERVRAEDRRAEALIEGARGAFIRSDPLEARAKLSKKYKGKVSIEVYISKAGDQVT